MAEVSIRMATYSAPGIEALLEPLGGMERFVGREERVLLKVNLLSAKEPEKAVTNHPEFVRAVARAARGVGGHPISHVHLDFRNPFHAAGPSCSAL